MVDLDEFRSVIDELGKQTGKTYNFLQAYSNTLLLYSTTIFCLEYNFLHVERWTRVAGHACEGMWAAGHAHRTGT